MTFFSLVLNTFYSTFPPQVLDAESRATAAADRAEQAAKAAVDAVSSVQSAAERIGELIESIEQATSEAKEAAEAAETAASTAQEAAANAVSGMSVRGQDRKCVRLSVGWLLDVRGIEEGRVEHVPCSFVCVLVWPRCSWHHVFV